MDRPEQKHSVGEAGAAPMSLGPWLRQIADQHTARPALKGVAKNGCAEEISFAELDQRTARLAAGLERLGLQRNDSIAIWLPNSPTWMILHLAAARLGLTTVPVNTWSRASELTHFLRLGRCRAIFLDQSFRGIDFGGILDETFSLMNATADNPLRWIIDAGNRPEFPASGRMIERLSLSSLETPASQPPEVPQAENRAMITFPTSGTTALPKLAVHREFSLVAHAQAVARKARMTPADIVLCALPPCGAYGYGLILASLASGSKAIQCEEFDLDQIVELIEREHATILALTEPLIRRLLDHPRASREAFSSLRLVFSAGGTLESVVRRAEDEFGFRITNVYGSSEILALAAFWGFDCDVPQRSAAGGRLVSDGMQVRAIDPSGVPLTVKTPGELQFRGPVMMVGYLANAEATAAAFSPDGWFGSQDLGYVLNDAGTKFHYVARLNDALRLKGFLVNPGEIEAMLQRHPTVTAAQVVGLPDGTGEDLAAAFVILNKDATTTAGDLRHFCQAHMASYKTPAILQIVDAFPTTRSANGDKVVKHRLREMAKELLLHDQ